MKNLSDVQMVEELLVTIIHRHRLKGLCVGLNNVFAFGKQLEEALDSNVTEAQLTQLFKGLEMISGVARELD